MDQNLLTIIIMVVAVVGGRLLLDILLPSKKRTRKSKQKSKPVDSFDDTDTLDDFPYQAQHSVLSPTELNFYQNLTGVLKNQVTILIKINLGDLFWVQVNDHSLHRSYRNKIDRKHVDFLLCNSATMQPILGLELDDSSHQRQDRQERDAFVDGVFNAAGLPILHIPAKRTYVLNDLTKLLAPYIPSLSVAIAPPPTPENKTPILPTSPLETSTKVKSSLMKAPAPYCPKCNDMMVLRTVKTGVHAGKQFWGCKNYPKCREMLPYKQEAQ